MKKHSQWDRFLFACNGVRMTWKGEASFRAEVAVCVMVAIVLWVRSSALHVWLAWGLGTTLILAAELINTAIEAVCDALHPGEDSLIGFAKDCAAGAVLVISVGMMALMTVILWKRW